MPTIHHRARFAMVGTLLPSLVELRQGKSLCPPYDIDYLLKERRGTLASKSAAPFVQPPLPRLNTRLSSASN